MSSLGIQHDHRDALQVLDGALREIGSGIGGDNQRRIRFTAPQQVRAREFARVETRIAAPQVNAEREAGLCLKAGNACILRGGSDSLRSNSAIAATLSSAVRIAGLPADAIQLIDSADRDSAGELMKLNGLV
ncbi:MAG: hypothetical protein ACREXT_11130, partial [Gammaproteobacteria bacterium]